jgi:broad specificity phosphatase PhoE
MGNCLGPVANFPQKLQKRDGFASFEIIGATGVPKADLTSESDPYIKAYIIRGKKKKNAGMIDHLTKIVSEGGKSKMWMRSSADQSEKSEKSESTQSSNSASESPPRRKSIDDNENFTGSNLQDSDRKKLAEEIELDEEHMLQWKRISVIHKTTTLQDEPNPIYHSYADFDVDITGDYFYSLVVEIYDWDQLNADDFLCRTAIPLTVLESGEPVNWKINGKNLEDFVMGGRFENHPNLSVTVRQVVSRPATTKTVFFIRHGESKWNEAQAGMNVKDMLKQNDHPLNAEGIEQALHGNSVWKGYQASQSSDVTKQESSTSSPNSPSQLSEKDRQNVQSKLQAHATHQNADALIGLELELLNAWYTERFFNAEKVVASPLTRALQTALIMLEDHPVLLRNDGVLLYSQIRECKRLGGMDSVGVAKGAEILPRLRSESLSELGKEKVDKLIAPEIKIDAFFDTDQEWWVRQSSYEEDKTLGARVKEAVNFIRHSPHDTIICVGHSLFFREIFKQLRHPAMLKTRPDIASDMVSKKLNNAAVFGTTVEFGLPVVDELSFVDNDKKSKKNAKLSVYNKFDIPRPYIVDGHLLFGSVFQKGLTDPAHRDKKLARNDSEVSRE